MVFLAYPSTRTAWLLPQIKTTDGAPPHPHLTTSRRDSLPLSAPPAILTAPLPPSPPSSPSLTTRINPAVLFIIVILAVIFFISGLLHLLVRFLIRKSPGSASSPQSGGRHAASRDAVGSDALQRQLQQLFHLHDSGLDQSFIDALPVFLYREIVGPKEPFDCAVCLCEFATDDHLRLLPACGHAFHLQCIDTWLLSNSTCPLCRDALFVPGLAIENPIYDFDEPREEEGFSVDRDDGLSSLPGRKPEEAENIVERKRVFPVRLGKFRRLSNGDDGDNGDAGNGAAAITITTEKGEQGETSSSNLDARRCYSMGCCQYVVGDADLRVALPHGSMRFGDGKGVRGRGLNGNLIANGVEEGRRLSVGIKRESFSVSKIWLWSNKKGKFPVSSDASSLDGNLPWLRRSVGDA